MIIIIIGEDWFLWGQAHLIDHFETKETQRERERVSVDFNAMFDCSTYFDGENNDDPFDSVIEFILNHIRQS